MTEKTADATTLGESLDTILESIGEIIARSHKQLATAKEVLTGIHQASGKLLETITASPEMKKTKPAMKKTRTPRDTSTKKPAAKAGRKSPAEKKTTTGLHKESEKIPFAGKIISLPGGAAQVMHTLIGGRGEICPQEILINGGAASSLPSHLKNIKKALTKAFGEKGSGALITHRGEGYSLSEKALH